MSTATETREPGHRGGHRVAILGATGAVGAELLTILEQRRFPLSSLRLLASPRSAGQQITFAGTRLAVEPVTPESFRGIDIAFFSAGGSTSTRYAPIAAAAGAVVIDNSSAFRMDPDVPLVVPEVNPGALKGHRGIIANPNCSTILLVMTLAPLQVAAGLERVVLATYQAASGAGQRAMDEMRQQTRALLASEPVPEGSVLPHDLAFNLFPRVDVFMADGYTREEDKLMYETRRILALPDLPVEATCVRVPVDRCHSEAVTVGLRRPLSPEAAREILAAAPGVVVEDDPAASRYPQPRHSSGTDPVAVGRIRASRVFAPGLTYWLCGDQLRKGAALNAVQIAESL